MSGRQQGAEELYGYGVKKEIVLFHTGLNSFILTSKSQLVYER